MNQTSIGFYPMAMFVVMAFAITTMKCIKNDMFPQEVGDDNSLRSLILSGNGSLNPEFDPEELNYLYSVSDTIDTITLTPKAYSKMSKIKINNKVSRSHAKSAPIPLKVGKKNKIVIQVTAENGIEQEYTIIVEHLASNKKGHEKGEEKSDEKGIEKGGEKSDDNTLKSLTMSGNGSWDPEFDSEVSVYTYTVTNTYTSITVTPETNSGMSKITINGRKCRSNEKSIPIPLKIGGRNEIVIQVEAENGDIRKYIVMVKRLPERSDDNYLKSLSLSGNGSWDRQFNRKVLNYTYTVPNTVESITLTPVSNSTLSKITINGEVCTSNEESSPVSLETGIGKNVIAIQVEAENGNGRQYTVMVVRLDSGGNNKEDDAALSSLTVSGAPFTPDFNPDILAYTASVPETKVPLDVNAVARSSKATINFKLDGKDVKNQHEVNFSHATATLVAEVTSGDGSTKKNYTVVVIKSNYSSKPNDTSKSSANLRGMDITFGRRNSKRPVYHSFNEPKKTNFDPAVTNYAVVVYACESITLKATAEDPAVISIFFNDNPDGRHRNGVKTGSVKLAAGIGRVTKVTISVTGRDRSTVKKYIFAVKLLNADEFYWGIYTPSFTKSFARWRKEVSSPGLGLNQTIKGYASGTLRWWIELNESKLKNNMKFSDYCDGNDDQRGTLMYTPYNDNIGENSKDGFVIKGSTTGEVNLEGNGSQKGTYQLTTPWGDRIGSIDIHYILKDRNIADDKDSYGTFTYMGEKFRYPYIGQGDIPYPFTKDYDWDKPWKWKK